ncbi:hypothetical protein H310_07693 [Aphanomyces invadans]|uniref:Uncharacterized protein n=1 Tax=Aphanomyces invadans TaxID=157072 RepID=A0A024U3X2_9STRA|nr:hypothetical protein H310_07693 [Aphanomyces invadans]ETW00323.1 hypothetical protein H310_07693 [Aphanomyces invadans]|eukprot:XP_008871348.1 hypothetical protein H310_07693 [Aphanomyces invadans]
MASSTDAGAAAATSTTIGSDSFGRRMPWLGVMAYQDLHLLGTLSLYTMCRLGDELTSVIVCLSPKMLPSNVKLEEGRIDTHVGGTNHDSSTVSVHAVLVDESTDMRRPCMDVRVEIVDLHLTPACGPVVHVEDAKDER